MPVYKKILKIKEKDYKRLKKDFSTILDLYESDNSFYVMGKMEDLRALNLDLDIPFY